MQPPASVAHLARAAIGLPELLLIFAAVLTLLGVYRLRGQATVNRSAFERSRWRGGRYAWARSSSRVRCGSQGGTCDPSQNDDAGRTPASELRAEYDPRVPALGRTLFQTLQTIA